MVLLHKRCNREVYGGHQDWQCNCYDVLDINTRARYAKRADMLLKAKRPVAAIADAEKALELNPDSAKATRVKGLAHRKLGQWDDAHKYHLHSL